MAEAGRGRIDIHHHFFTPEYLAVMGEIAQMPMVREWTIERAVEEMDRNGVDTAILSVGPPGTHLGTEAANRHLARAMNDHAAALRTEYPTRLGNFAAVPMPDVDGTLAEIAYVMDTLGVEGIQLMTSYGDRWPGHPDFDPVFDELNRRKAVVFIHPLEPSCCAGIIDWVRPALAEYTADTTRCVFSLLFSGTLARRPDIRFVFCHGGASVPIFAGRAHVMGLERSNANKLPNGIDHELRKLHYDIALATNRPALLALFDYVPVSQVLLGTDYPWGNTSETLAELKAFGLDSEDVEAVCCGNAQKLIPSLSN